MNWPPTFVGVECMPKVPSPPARVARGRERVRVRGAVQHKKNPAFTLSGATPSPPALSRHSLREWG